MLIGLFIITLLRTNVMKMTKILLLSDTHSYLGKEMIAHAETVDEVWHAGDIGDVKVMDQLRKVALVRGVYGNIDDATIRNEFPENLIFNCEGVKVFMTHIGGYPPKYNARVKKIIEQERPKLYICGHSHILKVMPDKTYGLLHMNPGAIGQHGFHQKRTMLKFTIHQNNIKDLMVVEMER